MVTGIKSSIMEIDTLTKEISVDDEATESKFLSAKTPKHDNKASSKSPPQGKGTPAFNTSTYSSYPQGHNVFRPHGLYNPAGHPAYYGSPSVMVSPGSNLYMSSPGPYHLNSDKSGQNRYPGQPFHHPMYGASPHFHPHMGFSRAISTSFGDNNSNSSSHKKREEDKISSASDDSLPKFKSFDNDDKSMASQTSWKILNQVASIEEEKFQQAENGGDLENIHDSSRTDLLSSVASIEEHLNTSPSGDIDKSNSKDHLDLMQAPSNGSLLFNEPFSKRIREERGDIEDMIRGGEDEIRNAPSERDDNDELSQPRKRRAMEFGGVEVYYEPSLSYTFSLESAASFSKDHEFESLPAFEIKQQNSFGTNLTIGSNKADAPIITSSFSFDRDSLSDIDIKDGKKHSSKYPPKWVTNLSHNHSYPVRQMNSMDSRQSGRSSPSSSTLQSHRLPFGPLHGPYGTPMPPHIPKSDGHLPPSFRPPPNMSGLHHLGRMPHPPVFMMSSPPEGKHSVSKNTGIVANGSKAKASIFNWTKDDDNRLTDIMKKIKNPKDWEPVAREFGKGKTAKECHERWNRYLKPGVRKGQWQDHEDAIVLEAVTTSKEQPFTRWSDLAQKLPGRVGKQIRDRWVNHLNPNINHMPFSHEDDLLLWKGHQKLGKRWVEISTKYFNCSRSENHIKNRWYSASFKKFVATEFGPLVYSSLNKKIIKERKKEKK